MSYFVQKPGFIDNRVMWADIIKELTSNGGFTLISVDGSTLVPAINDVSLGIDSAVIQATPLVDMLAEDQPWRICVKVTAQTTRLYAAPPKQIEDDGTLHKASKYNVGATVFPNYAGCIGDYHMNMPSAPESSKDKMFWGKGDQSTSPSRQSNLMNGSFTTDVDEADFQAIPFSYAISTTDHGIMFASWIEGLDGTGNNQNWFCIQRAINSDGSVVSTGKAPLFCLHSINSSSIKRFTVREADVNAPTDAVDATTDTDDYNRVINDKQQVCFNENGRYDFKFPQGFNTARHSYAYQLDMIAYTSADVCSQRIDVQVQVYNEKNVDGTPKLRTYRALSANSPNNTGMRPFMLVPTV